LDSDDDGDGVEDALDPDSKDLDGDGTPDFHDWDDDNDGIPDEYDAEQKVVKKTEEKKKGSVTPAQPKKKSKSDL